MTGLRHVTLTQTTRPRGWAAALLVLALVFVGSLGAAQAQETGKVQSVTGTIRPGEYFWYLLPELQSGQTLYVQLQAASGNLDPLVALIDGSQDTEALEQTMDAIVQQALAEGRDPLIAVEEAADELFLIWDDDGGQGLAAAFAYPVPASGDYRLLVAGALTALGGGTFGDYELLIGLDAPQVLTGEAAPTGDSIAPDVIAVLDREASPPDVAVEEVTGTITAEKPDRFFELHELQTDDTIYVFVEATSGDLRPALVLRDYADKPVRTANLTGQESHAALEYALEDRGRSYALEVAGEGTAGDFRLLLGINAPEVLAGQATPSGRAIIKEPIPVQIGVKIQQIVEVDEQNEFFTAVASLQMEWTDPALAFSPDSCDCVVKTYSEQNFSEFLADTQGRWPVFTLYNQQGNRWTQNRVAVIRQDGRALYFERFSTDLQVDFDFRQYPFDTEEFLIQIDAVFPEDYYYFTDLEGYSEVSAEHGEDEFAISDFETSVTSEQASTQATTSRFTLRFGGPRHLDYYIVQIFVPLLLILAVSWVTFFLRDYGRRIEVASANLFVFIAFSFSLSDNYPRLGYITLLDAVMTTLFVVNALVVVYNVWLRRLEMNEQGELADRIDRYLDWIYPISLVAAAVVLYVIFF